MPLTKSSGNKAWGKNYGKEVAAGKSKAQAATIASSVQAEAKKKKKK